MLANDRLNKIVQLVEQRRSISVQDLMKALNASESTIRRDLSQLDMNGQIKKVHGGAIANSKPYFTTDAEVIVRQNLNHDEKEAIARYAATLIVPGDFVFMDAGTTTELMIPYIQCKDAVFVTNAFSHAKQLAKAGMKTYILGGELKAMTEAVIGEEAIHSLSKYNFSKGFFGTNGITVNNGFTTPEISEAMVKRTAMSRCREKYVLADSTKFSFISSITFADFDTAKILTTEILQREYMSYNNILEVNKL